MTRRFVLGLEINRRLEAAVHIHGHRFMNVTDEPLPVDLPETKSLAKPNVCILAIGSWSGPTIQSMAVGDVIAHDNFAIANFEPDGTTPRCEPAPQILLERQLLQWVSMKNPRVFTESS